MKVWKKILAGTLSAAMMLSMSAVANVPALGVVEAKATESLTDLGNSANWSTDRTEPVGWNISDGKISFSVSENPAAESWYAYQGRKAYTNYPVSTYWCEEHTFDITSDMLSTNNINVSLWIQVDQDGVGTAASQQNCVDWSIIQFINVSGNAT